MIEIGNNGAYDFLQAFPENRNITSNEFGKRFINALMATGQAVINQFLITLVCHHQPLMGTPTGVWSMIHRLLNQALHYVSHDVMCCTFGNSGRLLYL